MGNDKSEGSGNDKSEGSGCFKSITEKNPSLDTSGSACLP